MLKWSELSPRERDALVAEKVMGFTVTDWPTGKSFPVTSAIAAGVLSERQESRIPHYTTQIAAAWEVVEKLRREKMLVTVVSDEDGGWNAEMWDYNNRQSGEVFAESAPEAICLAALRACGVEIE